MGDSGYIFGYMLLFAFFVGGLVGSFISYWLYKHEDKEDEE